ncbi:hypothetical protein PVAP13_1NG199576 [Panicum virgatum]|nr:hypothetical protein PVAP13_1NG199576 [Panicum virgatum]
MAHADVSVDQVNADVNVDQVNADPVNGRRSQGAHRSVSGSHRQADFCPTPPSPVVVCGSPGAGAAAAGSRLPRDGRRRHWLVSPLGGAPPPPPLVRGSLGRALLHLHHGAIFAAASPLTVTPKRLCPILEVSLDFVKSLYAKFIDWDEDMYDLENDTPAHAANPLRNFLARSVFYPRLILAQLLPCQPSMVQRMSSNKISR